MVSVEYVLLLEAFLCVLASAIAVSYRYRRNSASYNPKDRAVVNNRRHDNYFHRYF